MRIATIAICAAAVTIGGFACSGRADAQDPRCANMRDKAGCNCALQNGGRIVSNSQRWTYPQRSINAFAACRSGKK